MKLIRNIIARTRSSILYIITLFILFAAVGCTVKVDPESCDVNCGETKQFTATVKGLLNKNVTWSIDEGDEYGTISPVDASTAVYTAPAILPTAPTNATVRATSVANPKISGEAYVQITDGNETTSTTTTASIVDPTTPGYMELGRGTDVFGEYASENNVLAQVLDIDALNAQNYLVLNTSVNESKIQKVSGSEVSEYASSLGITVGLEGTYKWFSASIKTAFTTDSYRMSAYSYVTVMERHFMNSLKIRTDRWDAAYLKQYLTVDASMAINNTDPVYDWTPEELIKAYGTHVMVGIFTGARLDYNMAINDYNSSNQSSLQIYAEASAGFKFGSASFSTEIDQTTWNEMSSYYKVENILTKGGDSQYSNPADDDAYQQWKTSITTNPSLVGIMKNALVPIWEFADDSARQNEIKSYYEDYAAGIEADFTTLPYNCIVDVKIGNSYIGPYLDPDGFWTIPQDLNEGAGGAFLYVMYKYGLNTNTDPAPITALKVVDTSYDPVPDPSSGWISTGIDLNQGAGGHFIYLYYKREAGGFPITSIATINLDGKKNYGFPDGVSNDNRGHTYFADNHDLNAGSGGDFIYFAWIKDYVD